MIITYTFTDPTGSEIEIPRTLTFEYLRDAEIYEPPSVEFCQNVGLYYLSGNYDEMMTGYNYSGSGVGVDTSGYYFDPGIAPLGTHWVLYEYVSDNQCSVRDSIQLTVKFAPMAAFNLAEPCVQADGAGGSI